MSLSTCRQEKGITFIVLFFLLAGITGSIILLALVPPTSRDALIHHLQIPKLYLLHGGMYEIPDLVFSYYPMNLDLLYMAALYFGNDILPKFIHAAFGFATAYLIYSYLKERISSTCAILGTIFFLSIPIIVKLSITVYVDLGLIFFSTASLLLLFKWVGKDPTTSSRPLLLAGICCGLAIGTKYNGLLVLFLLTLFTPILYIRSSRVEGLATIGALRTAALFFFCALLAASPWLIRNCLWTGNPLYPLYDGFFNPAVNTGTVTESSAIQGVFATRYVLYHENIWQLLLLPIRVFFEGVDNDPRYFDGRLNPFLLLLSFFAFANGSLNNRQQHLEKITLLAFCVFYFLFAFNTGVLRIRYMAPIIPFMVILAMFGLHNIAALFKLYFKQRFIAGLAVCLLTTLMLFPNIQYISLQFKNVSPFDFISGRISREDYLAQHIPSFKVMEYANNHLPLSARILCINMGWQGYYLNREHLFDYGDNRELLLAWLNKPGMTAERILANLQEKQISNLLIRMDLLQQWWLRADPIQQDLWLKLQKNCLKPLSSNQNYTLYQIRCLNR